MIRNWRNVRTLEKTWLVIVCVSLFVCFLNQELLKPAAQTGRSEETCGHNVKVDDDDETVEVTAASRCSDADVEVGYSNPLLCVEENTHVSWHTINMHPLPIHIYRQRSVRVVLWRGMEVSRRHL